MPVTKFDPPAPWTRLKVTRSIRCNKPCPRYTPAVWTNMTGKLRCGTCLRADVKNDVA